MFGLALYTASQDRSRETRIVEENAVRLARLIGLEEKRLFDQTRVLLYELSYRPEVAAAAGRDCSSALAQTLAHFQRYANLAVAELDGTLSCSAVPLESRFNVADRGYFRRTVETADFAFGSYGRERVTGIPALVFGYPVLDHSGRTRRVVSAAVALVRLSRFEETVEAQLPRGSTIAKIDRDGRILALAPYVPDRIGSPVWAVDALKPLAAQGHGVIRVPDDRGVPRVYAVARAPYSLHAGAVAVVLGIPETIAYADIDHALRRTLGALAALTGLIVITTWLISTSMVGRPLGSLLAATRRMAQGEYGLRLKPLYSAGEFGRLAQSFDEMAEAVQVRERALAQSEARYRSLFEGAPYGVFITDPDGRFREVNPAFAAMLGYSVPDLLGQESVPFYEVKERSETLFQLLRKGERVQGVEVRLRRRDGKPVLVRGGGRLVRDAHGNVVAQEIMVEDVTEQRKLEEQFQQSQKLEAIGRLAGGVAHDFNNLLTVILGYADLIAGELQDPVRGDFEEIRRAALRATSLTQQLLAFSRRQLLDAEPVNLNEILTGTEKMLRRVIGEDVELVTSFEPALGTVRIDRGQIEQVVLNLAINARDALPRGGRLILETRNQTLTSSPLHEAASMPPGRYVTLSVADTGIGMDAETKARIFEPFFTTKERGKGTGLGLSTVFGIVKQSGGFIWVYSDLGKGTTFKIYLPRTDEPAGTIPPPEAAVAVSGAGERVLLVEDDDSVRTVTEKILTAHGYDVLPVKTAEEAVDLARRVVGTIDLLVTDIVLPVMSGPELATRLAGERSVTRVLYVSGYLPETASHFFSLGSGARMLQKPFTADTLLRKIREVLQTRA